MGVTFEFTLWPRAPGFGRLFVVDYMFLKSLGVGICKAFKSTVYEINISNHELQNLNEY